LRKSVSIDTVFQSGGKIGPPALLITTIGDSMQVPQKLKIAVENAGDVSALLLLPSDARACFVFGHGAGAGMAHRFMEATATGLCERGVATLRYQFPYMEQGSRRPDGPDVAHASVRAAVAEASRCCPRLSLFAGGKSFGGRMTSQAQAIAPLPRVSGLIFLGFPLHPLGKPSADRAKHLSSIHVPMRFVQGSRDKLAELQLLEPVVNGLAAPASLQVIEQADHSFHVPARSGRKDGEVLAEILDGLSAWIDGVAVFPP
jgi:predicted alpha/beta-hydrolase family hydrolase